MAKYNRAEFVKRLRRAPNVIREEFRKQRALICYEVYRDNIVDASPVKTGNYRARHMVRASGTVIYSHPQKLTGRTKPPKGTVIPRPDFRKVRAVLLRLPLNSRIVFENDAYYAGIIENGNATRRGLHIYDRAGSVFESRSRRIEKEIQKALRKLL